uniref:Uncharacterized protein n=1 Tax=Heterorhabditis bacteriophora TaxID=37862 RepID=A0A1I7WJ94_HETBA
MFTLSYRTNILNQVDGVYVKNKYISNFFINTRSYTFLFTKTVKDIEIIITGFKNISNQKYKYIINK